MWRCPLPRLPSFHPDRQKEKKNKKNKKNILFLLSFFHRGLILFPLFYFLYISPPLFFSFSLAGRTTVSHRQQSSASLHSAVSLPLRTPNNTPLPPSLPSPSLSQNPRRFFMSQSPPKPWERNGAVGTRTCCPVLLPLYLQLTLIHFSQPPFFHILSLYQQCQPQQPRPQQQHQPPALLRYPHDHRL